eukprot:COSAG06_NODE_5639_length_3346_cov_2.415460_3_plen_93_part_00
MRTPVHRRHRHATHGTIVLFCSTIPRVQGVSASQLWHAAQGCAGATQLPLAPFSSCEKRLLFSAFLNTMCVSRACLDKQIVFQIHNTIRMYR